MIISNVLEHPDWKKTRMAMELGLRSYIGYPLRVGDRIIGGINCQSQALNFFREEDLNLIASLASQAAIAIENARLHEEAWRSRNFFQSVVNDNADEAKILDTLDDTLAQFVGERRDGEAFGDFCNRACRPLAKAG